MKIISHSTEETADFAKLWLDSLKISQKNRSDANKSATVIGLYGDLGSGKTAYTQAVAKALGVVETVTSPTFVIEKIYALESPEFKHLIHIDAYRLAKSEELKHLGWHDIIKDPANLILIEWPERVSEIMPAEHIQIKFNSIDPTTREIEVL